MVHLIIHSMDLMCTNSKFTVPSGGNVALFTIEDTVSTLKYYCYWNAIDIDKLDLSEHRSI